MKNRSPRLTDHVGFSTSCFSCRCQKSSPKVADWPPRIKKIQYLEVSFFKFFSLKKKNENKQFENELDPIWNYSYHSIYKRRSSPRHVETRHSHFCGKLARGRWGCRGTGTVSCRWDTSSISDETYCRDVSDSNCWKNWFHTNYMSDGCLDEKLPSVHGFHLFQK